MTAADLTAARPVRPSGVSRLYGLGSIFGKGLRDSRWAIIGFGGSLALIVFATASQLALEFEEPAERAALAAQMGALPALFRGLLGEPINIETLGGFLSWRAMNFMSIMIGIWSVMALSGTLAGEAARGSLELVVAAPVSRGRVAVEKAAVHVVGLALAMAVLALAVWAGTLAFGTLAGDEVSLAAALAGTAVLGLEALVGGAVAFALAPVFGRGVAAAAGGVVLFGSFIVNGYAETVPAFDAIRSASYFAWTADHRPIAGATDWVGFGMLAAVVLGLLAAGVVTFRRRDVGITTSLGIRGPRIAIGLRGPFGRSFGERLPGAVGWGVGIGLYGTMIAASASAFAEQLSAIPQMAEIMARFYPGIDFSTSAGVLQLAFFGFGLLLMGLAAATFVSGWSSDESERRLETILSVPLTRFRWGVLSGLGVLAGVAVTSVLLSTFIALGAMADGNEPGLPFAGSLVAGAYAAALAGIGLAVGGLVRASLGAVTVVVLVVGFYLLDLLGPVLNLPEEVLWIGLNRHLGQPLIGQWDVPGMIACGVLAVGGVLLAAWGLSRRDVAR